MNEFEKVTWMNPARSYISKTHYMSATEGLTICSCRIPKGQTIDDHGQLCKRCEKMARTLLNVRLFKAKLQVEAAYKNGRRRYAGAMKTLADQ